MIDFVFLYAKILASTFYEGLPIEGLLCFVRFIYVAVLFFEQRTQSKT